MKESQMFLIWDSQITLIGIPSIPHLDLWYIAEVWYNWIPIPCGLYSQTSAILRYLGIVASQMFYKATIDILRTNTPVNVNPGGGVPPDHPQDSDMSLTDHTEDSDNNH